MPGVVCTREPTRRDESDRALQNYSQLSKSLFFNSSIRSSIWKGLLR